MLTVELVDYSTVIGNAEAADYTQLVSTTLKKLYVRPNKNTSVWYMYNLVPPLVDTWVSAGTKSTSLIGKDDSLRQVNLTFFASDLAFNDATNAHLILSNLTTGGAECKLYAQ